MRVLAITSYSYMLSALVMIAGTANGSPDTTVYTSQYRMPGYHRCYGECTRYSDYYYCYVDHNHAWDYCSPAPQGNMYARPLLNVAFTLEKGPCKDDCTYYRPEDRYMCHSYWDDWAVCDPKLYAFFKSYTFQGEECFGACDKHEGQHYNWCYDQQHNPKYCSPYKMNMVEEKIINSMLTVPACYLQPGGQECNARRKKRLTFCPAAAHTPGAIDAYITYLESIALVATSMYYYSQPNQNQGVYRYAYLHPITPGSPILPLLISARITRNTIRDPGTREPIPNAVQVNINMMGRHRGRADDNNDENGHLIASENGVPTEVYNFVPQPRSLNRGMVTGVPDIRSSARSAEDSIHHWVRDVQGHVDQTVVVVYDSVNGVVNPRPVGFTQHVVYYHANGTISYQCQDYYSNDPTHDPDLVAISP